MAYARDKGKMHSICSTPELSEERNFCDGLEIISSHHY